MNALIEFLKQQEGTVFVSKDGDQKTFRLLPPLFEQELAALTSSIPCALPEEIQELLKFCSGFDGTWLGEVTFAGSGIGLEMVFPHNVALAQDGLGNYWVVDLTSESTAWSPIFYVCHDAPVIVYQTDSLLHFVQEVIREGNKPWKSEIGEVTGSRSDQIWSDNPGVLTFSHCVHSADPELRTFAESLDETWLIVDLRQPALGDGFSWGRYGPNTVVKRFGEKRIFAYQKKSLLRRMLDTIR